VTNVLQGKKQLINQEKNINQNLSNKLRINLLIIIFLHQLSNKIKTQIFVLIKTSKSNKTF